MLNSRKHYYIKFLRGKYIFYIYSDIYPLCCFYICKTPSLPFSMKNLFEHFL